LALRRYWPGRRLVLAFIKEPRFAARVGEEVAGELVVGDGVIGDKVMGEAVMGDVVLGEVVGESVRGEVVGDIVEQTLSLQATLV
jgi:hypothetical protein